MEAHPATVETPPRAGIRLPWAGAALGRGLVGLYLSIMVLLPLAAVVVESTDNGMGAFWSAVILSIVYFVSVALIWAFMRLSGKDLLTARRPLMQSVINLLEF